VKEDMRKSDLRFSEVAMPEPLSLDLRERIVAAYERGDLTRDQVAEMFQVGRASVNRLVRRFRETGSVEPNPHGGGKPRKLTGRGEKALRALVAEHPDATIPELVRLLMARAKLAVSTSTMSRELTRLGFTRKKKSLVATEQTAPHIQALRDSFRTRARALDPRDLVFIDEAGSQIGMTREYARGPRGGRVHGYVPRNRGTVTTMIGCWRSRGSAEF
jgi:transposase